MKAAVSAPVHMRMCAYIIPMRYMPVCWPGIRVRLEMEVLNMNKMEEIIAASKLGEMLQKKQAEEQKKNNIICVLAAVGVVLAVGLAAYFIYRKLSDKAYDEFEDDFDDDFDDDFFEDEDEEENDL